jgi:hypothetical protein
MACCLLEFTKRLARYFEHALPSSTDRTGDFASSNNWTACLAKPKSRESSSEFSSPEVLSPQSRPNDFDVILVLDASIVDRDLRPFEYNLVSRSMARRLFGGDVMPALEGSSALERYVELFQTTRGGQRVGLVEIEL